MEIYYLERTGFFMLEDREFDFTEESIGEDSEEIIIEEIQIEEDCVREPSEFERELENYLPTVENTNKVRQPLPVWAVSAIASCGVCIIILLIYSILIMPNLRPKAVISYSAVDNAQVQTDDVPKSPIASLADSVVTITGTTSYHSFFGISSSKITCSGIVLSENGYILTSNSGLGQDGITVTINDKEYEAAVSGVDESKDIAVIKIEATGLTPAVLGDSDKLQMGDPVLCLGNILGEKMGTSATRGIISGVNREVSINGRSFNLLQTDAKTSDGSAGGPLANYQGEVIGMITYAVTTDAGEISFAIPSNDIKKVAESLISTGKAPEGLIIGITGTDSDHGVAVETVMEESPAEKAGICEGDLILKVDDTAVKSISDINKIKDTHKKGDKIKITIYRDGEVKEIELTL